MNADGDPLNLLWITLFFWLLFALINLAVSAVTYLNDAEIRSLSETNGRRGRFLKRMNENPTAFQSCSAVSMSLCGILCAACGSWWLLAAPLGWQWRAGLAVLGVFLLLLADTLPRKLAVYLSPNTAFSLASLLWLVFWLARPIVFATVLISRLVVRLTGHNPDAEPEKMTEEEIRMMVDAGEEKGVIERNEKTMINNIFEFDDRTAGEIMTHRTEIQAVPITATLEDVAQLAVETGYSRIPVYRDDIDTIIGVIYAKDLLKFLHNPGGFELASQLRHPLYVPETTRCNDLFATFKKERMQIAVVVDEYGGTYGIVTMEDLLESIVGNMEDEYDNEEAEFVQLDPGVYLLSGNISVEEASQLMAVQLPQDSDFDTLGGLVIDQLGYIPRSGDKPTVEIAGVQMTVSSADGKHIHQLIARCPLSEYPPAQPGEEQP